MSDITVYTKRVCPQCDQTKRMLNRQNVTYSEVRVDTDPQAVEELKQLGFMQVPVVVTPNETWSGFRYDKLRTL